MDLVTAVLALAGIVGFTSLLRAGQEEARRQKIRQQRELSLAVYPTCSTDRRPL